MKSCNFCALGMKRHLAAGIFGLTIAVLILAGCGGTSATTEISETAAVAPGITAEPSTGDSDPKIRDLLSDWFDYLYINERGYGNSIWVADTVLSFTAEPNWDRLLIAKMAVSAATLETDKRQLDPALLEKEDYDVFMGQGMDFYNIPLERESWGTERKNLLSQFKGIKDELALSVFWTYGLESLGKKAELNRGLSDAMLEYLAAETEYILFTLGEQESTASFRAFLSEHCPRIAAYLPEELAADEQAIQAKSNRVMDAMQSYMMELNALEGIMRADLDILSEWVESGDLSDLREKATLIENLPLVLPYPDWDYEDFEELYYWKAEAESLSVPSAGDEITKAPDGGRITFLGVEKDELLAYRDFLAEIGIDCLSTSEKDGECIVIYQFNTGTLSLIWKDADVEAFFMDGWLCFAPYWYIAAVGNN